MAVFLHRIAMVRASEVAGIVLLPTKPLVMLPLANSADLGELYSEVSILSCRAVALTPCGVDSVA